MKLKNLFKKSKPTFEDIEDIGPVENLETDQCFIKCECGVHLLSVLFEKELYGGDNVELKPKCVKTFFLAMFNYGDYGSKYGFWRRIEIAWKIIRKGKMHEDQLVLNPEEAGRLAEFINKNL